MPEMIEVHRVTGEDCFIVRAFAPSPSDLERIVGVLGRFAAVTTSVVLSSESPKPIDRQGQAKEDNRIQVHLNTNNLAAID